jgi:putative ABC transport system permease protein
MLRHYILLSVKVLLRRKVFTAISLFGIVSTLTVFVLVAAMFDHGFGSGEPETAGDRTLSVMRVNMFGEHVRMSAHGNYALFDRYARGLPGVQNLAILSTVQAVDSFVDGRKVSLSLKRTDAGFWRVFSFRFIEGRPFSDRDVNDAAFVAVITESTRDQLLGPGPAEGRAIEVDGQRFQVVGVVPDVSEMRVLPYSDVWVPATTAKSSLRWDGPLGQYQAVLVADSRESLPGIRAEFDARLARVELPSGVNRLIAPFETQFDGLARQIFPDDDQASRGWILVAAIVVAGSLLALLPAVNLVNLNLSRITERTSEIGVRKAFGASSRSLVGQFVVENVLLTLLGAMLAFVVSAVLLDAINTSGLIAHARLQLNLRVFLVGTAMALTFGVMSGVYPAWRMSRLHPVGALKGHTR